jgi:hypothetical protein
LEQRAESTSQVETGGAVERDVCDDRIRVDLTRPGNAPSALATAKGWNPMTDKPTPYISRESASSSTINTRGEIRDCTPCRIRNGEPTAGSTKKL